MGMFTLPNMLLTCVALLGGAGEAQAEEGGLEPRSLLQLAQRYEHAEGVPRDYQRAADLYCAAARAGLADAQYALGWMYANGRGVPRSDAIALQLFRIAAEQGHPQARQMTKNLAGEEVAALPACMTPEEPVIAIKKEVVPRIAYPQGKIAQLVAKLAPRYSVDPALAMAVITVESAFNERAVSVKNAQGLMQLTPDTAQRFSVRDAFDAEDNIKGGLSYLRWLLAFFRGNVTLVAAAYNAGERAVEKYRGIPPYLETHDYVKKVTGLYRKPTHPFQRNLVPSSTVVMRQSMAAY